MSDSAVARVLWALERVERELLALELAEQKTWSEVETHWDTWTVDEMRDHNSRSDQQLGRVQGYAAASVVVRNIIEEYRHKHSAARGGLQAVRLARLAEEGPTGSVNL